MAHEVETPEENAALEAALDSLRECGWKIEPDDDRRAFEIVWAAGRTWERERIDEDNVAMSWACEAGEHGDCRRTAPSGDLCPCACHEI